MPPNIVLILSDDLGWGDMSFGGAPNTSPKIPTPHLDALAASGMVFEQLYTNPTCAPSRDALMTGRHTGHATVRSNSPTYTPLRSDDVTVAQLLRRANYTTGLVGKWHLGTADTHSSGYPMQHGFDSWLGLSSPGVAWYPPCIERDNATSVVVAANRRTELAECVQPGAGCAWFNDLITEAALDFLREHAYATAPFFLYVASYVPHIASVPGVDSDWPMPHDRRVPHTPLTRVLTPRHHTDRGLPPPCGRTLATPRARAMHRRLFDNQGWGTEQAGYAAAVHAQDSMVGTISAELVALQLEEQTCVLFLSDNGPTKKVDLGWFDSAGGLRGAKTDLYEGGVRSSLVVSWPGTVTAGARSSALLAAWDVLPTLAELAGLPASAAPLVDGHSFAPLLLPLAPPPAPPYEAHASLYWEHCEWAEGRCDDEGLSAPLAHQCTALGQARPSAWVQRVRLATDADGRQWVGRRVSHGATVLYDLASDPTESTDVAAAHPAVVGTIEAAMDAAHSPDSAWPSSSSLEEPCCHPYATASGWPCQVAPGDTAPSPPPPSVCVSESADVCAGWCADNPGAWENKCGWINCNGCGPCLSLSPPPPPSSPLPPLLPTEDTCTVDDSYSFSEWCAICLRCSEYCPGCVDE